MFFSFFPLQAFPVFSSEKSGHIMRKYLALHYVRVTPFSMSCTVPKFIDSFVAIVRKLCLAQTSATLLRSKELFLLSSTSTKTCFCGWEDSLAVFVDLAWTQTILGIAASFLSSLHFNLLASSLILLSLKLFLWLGRTLFLLTPVLRRLCWGIQLSNFLRARLIFCFLKYGCRCFTLSNYNILAQYANYCPSTVCKILSLPAGILHVLLGLCLPVELLEHGLDILCLQEPGVPADGIPVAQVILALKLAHPLICIKQNKLLFCKELCCKHWICFFREAFRDYF